MRVIAIPNDAHWPEERGLAVADVVLSSLGELVPEVVRTLPEE
jgi:hypothetical protein